MSTSGLELGRGMRIGRGFSTSARHVGQVSCSMNQALMQALWKTWSPPHPTRYCVDGAMSSRHIAQSRRGAWRWQYGNDDDDGDSRHDVPRRVVP